LRALDGGEDGLRSLRAIAEAAPRFLSPPGILATEIGAGQAAAVARMMKDNGLIIDGIEKDLAGIARCVIASLPRMAGNGRKRLECASVPSRLTELGE
jgi:release factor glutamine methyltransferase